MTDMFSGLRKMLSLVSRVKSVSMAADKGDNERLLISILHLLGQNGVGLRDRSKSRTLTVRMKKGKGQRKGGGPDLRTEAIKRVLADPDLNVKLHRGKDKSQEQFLSEIRELLGDIVLDEKE